MKRYESLEQLQNDLDKGVQIFWCNTSYKVHYVPMEEHSIKDTLRDGKVIRVTCISNYFGSLLGINEFSSCFSKEGI